MRRSYLIFSIMTLILLVSFSCGRKSGALKSFPINSPDEVTSHVYAKFDKDVSADGKGSLRVQATQPVTIPLFKITDLKVDNTALVYTAKVKTDHVIGQVFLEMLSYFRYPTEVVSRGQETLLAGTNDWTEQRITLDLPKGQVPDSIKLNFVVNGQGTAWIDDVVLSKAPLGSSPKPAGQ